VQSVTLFHFLVEGQMFLGREGSLLHRFILKYPGDVVMNKWELVSSNSRSECCVYERERERERERVSVCVW
jgi:hypothetical protein